MRRAGLRARLAVSYAAAVAAALLMSGAAVLLVVDLDERAEHAAGLADDDSFEGARRVLVAMAVVAPLAVGGAALLGLALARRALAPLREASQRAQAARAASLDLRLPLDGAGDEWDELAVTLNALLADAHAAVERVRRFTADAAHELRTPLTALIGEADVALRRERPAADLARSLAVVKAEGERLAALVEALLTLARADAGTLLPSRSLLCLDDVAHEAVGRAVARSGGRAISSCGLAGDVRGDRLLLVRAVENLLDNAVRHGAGPVRVELSSFAGTARLRVSDEGPGVPQELAATLFERFARGDPARSGEGFGLGLPIARAIAEAHGGALVLLPSERGAVFQLELPLA